jgi:hypothetical protein
MYLGQGEAMLVGQGEAHAVNCRIEAAEALAAIAQPQRSQ